MKSRVRAWLGFILIAMAAMPAGEGQNASPEAPGSSAQADMIHVFATVRDKHGKIVSTLQKDDFALSQDDHPQTIQSLMKDSDLPLSFGVLFQTSRTDSEALDEERSASHDFFDQMLRENKDKAFVIHFDHEVELLQDLTNSRDKLFNALGLLQASRPDENTQDSSGDGPQQPASGHRGGNTLFDAIYLASNEVMKGRHDRKAVVVISDGIDRGSKETVGSAIESAQRTETAVYTILVKDESERRQGGFGFPGGIGAGRRGGGPRAPEEPHPDPVKILEQIAKATGGEYFDASKRQPVAQIYNSIQEDLRHQYELSYTPEKSGDWAGFHKIQLTVKQKEMQVAAREGFYVASPL
jgi:VWFA-related protein